VKAQTTKHPGALLKDRLAESGLSVRRLAKSLKLTPPRINEIVRERRGMTAETAILLGAYFGDRPEFWLDLQRDFDLAQARKTMKARKRA
jgi:addiction module HigA family antidote